MFNFKAIFTFFLCFMIFGTLGFLFDLVTGGRYGVRAAATASSQFAITRTASFVRSARRGWFLSPLVFFAFLVSPVFFVFVLFVAIWDCYTETHVIWRNDGTRLIIDGRDITEEDLQSSVSRSGLTAWIRSKFGKEGTGSLYKGHPVAPNWAPLASLTLPQRKACALAGWKVIHISGQPWLVPPMGRDSEAVSDLVEVADDIEVDLDEQK